MTKEQLTSPAPKLKLVVDKYISAAFNCEHDKVQTCKFLSGRDFEKHQSIFGRSFEQYF
jgi:hypothetical protein